MPTPEPTPTSRRNRARRPTAARLRRPNPTPAADGSTAGFEDCRIAATKEESQSKSLRQACTFDRMLAVRAGHLAAEPWRWKDLAGVAEILWIECGPDALHRIEVGLREHPRHVFGLVRAHAVLARDRSARLDTVRENLAGHFDGAIGIARDALVVA